jgi:hypothetical protein
MKKQDLVNLIEQEVKIALSEKQLTNETYNLGDVKYPSSLKQPMDKLVDSLQKSNSLTKQQVAAMFNDICLALDISKAEVSAYMNMISQYRTKYKF